MQEKENIHRRQRGGVTGGVLGLLAGIGALAIPGVGPFIAATLGGIAGALIGMGIPEYEAKQYEAKIKEGNILISVHTVMEMWLAGSNAS